MVLLGGLCRNEAGRVKQAQRQGSAVAATGFQKRKAKEGRFTCDLKYGWPHVVPRVLQCTVLANGENGN